MTKAMMIVGRVLRRRRPGGLLRSVSAQAVDDGHGSWGNFGENEFDVMGVPVDVRVDLRKLEANMRNLQRQFHPDKYAQAPRGERLRAEEASARVNTSYSVVKDPLQRANRAIALKLGRDVLAEADIVDMDLLDEILEIRQAIEETENLDDLRKIKHDNNAKMRQTHLAIIDHYKSNDFDQAATDLIRLQYCDKIRTEILAISERRGWDLHVCQVPII